MAFRILVCGGRAYNNAEGLRRSLDCYAVEHADLELICGFDPDGDRFQGADQLAFEWAIDRGIPAFPFPAPWKKHGRGAGPMRNSRMLRYGRPHIVIAFPGGAGTADMLAKAARACVEIDEFTELASSARLATPALPS